MLLVFTLAFASGVTLASTFRVNWLICMVVCCSAVIAFLFSSRALPVLVAVIGLTLGIVRFLAFFPPGWNIDSYSGPAPVTLYGQVATDPSIDGRKATFLLSTDEVVTRSCAILTRGTCVILVHGAALSTLPDIRFGDKVRITGLLQSIFPTTNPGEFDYKSSLVRRGVSGELVVQRPDGVSVVLAAGPVARYRNWASATQRRFHTEFAAVLPAPEAGLLTGILFGDRSGITPELSRQFASTGTSHILATAGLHIGILAATLYTLFTALIVPRKLKSVLIILLLWAFDALAGGRPAVTRAVATATVYFGGKVLDRVPDTATAFAAAALGILLTSPSSLFDSGFQLSFMTVAGLFLLMPYWDRFWRPRLDSLKNLRLRSFLSIICELLGLSLFAQLCAAPLIAYYFNQLSLLSLPVNLVVVPILFMLIPLAIITLLASTISQAAAILLSKFLLHPLLWAILHTVAWFASLPFCSLAVPSPPPVLIVFFYMILVGFALNVHKTLRTKQNLTKIAQMSQ